VQIRLLGSDERERLLDLLDLWPQEYGWPGRDFFGRYLEQDVTFCDENVIVAESDGELVGCVQIFPRPVRMRGSAVAMGGIGSVFTRPARRGHAIATRMLERASKAMRERGMLVSLLFANPLTVSLYERQGWSAWGARALLLTRESKGGSDADLDSAPFDRGRDLSAVRALHEAYSAALDGSVVRDDALWETSLRVAGNPSEEFRVARRPGRAVAYLRTLAQSGFLILSELGRDPDAGPELAALIDAALTPREDDPLARPERPSDVLRSLAILPILSDDVLLSALAERGIAHRAVDNPLAMWRCLDPAGLARALGVQAAASENPNALLARVLPPGDFVYWPADRF